jgi:hypothetical protein
VQVTEFAGGIALGVALNHVATDGIGFFRFMQMWAASAVAAGAISSDWTWTEPLHGRRFVRFDGDQELARRLLRQAAPDLPRVSYYYLSVATTFFIDGARYIYLLITKTHIHDEKQTYTAPVKQSKTEEHHLHKKCPHLFK